MNAEKTEQLMKLMRERALAMMSNPEQDTQLLKGRVLAQANKERLERIEEFKKLYFNAGRWAGGARDYTARKAFERINNGQEYKS